MAKRTSIKRRTLFENVSIVYIIPIRDVIRITYICSCVKFPPIKKPAIRGGLRKAGMKQDVQEKPHLDRFIKTAVKIKEAGYGRQM